LIIDFKIIKNTNMENIENIENELSYEEEQLQLLLLKESFNKKLEIERKLKNQQDEEYKKSLMIDENKQNNIFEEISLEEMRRIRLLRFNNL